MLKQVIKNCIPYGIVNKMMKPDRIYDSASEIPNLYNNQGEKMYLCYLQDTMCVHTPYTLVDGRYPKRVLWDRSNKALKRQFYTHKDIFRTVSNGQHQYAILRESEEICPEDYVHVINNLSYMKEFDRVFTHSEALLEQLSNAAFVPANGVWYATPKNGGTMDSLAYQHKNRNISIVASDKITCKMHRLRLDIANRMLHTGLVDCYGAFCGKKIPQKADALRNYRYSIAIENATTPFYFTEKILDCFAAMTVPIYIGATKISHFFNEDGIICVAPEDYDKIEHIITQCSQLDYENRRAAVLDNYNRVQEYLCYEDYITAHYEDCLQ